MTGVRDLARKGEEGRPGYFNLVCAFTDYLLSLSFFFFSGMFGIQGLGYMLHRGAGRLVQEDRDEFLQRRKLLLVDELELVAKQDKVFQRRVEMWLQAQLCDLVKVVAIDVSVDSE